MKKYRVLVTAIAAAAFLAACGGSDPGNQNPRVSYTRMVNFGDSLSDVGTYRTAIVAANGDGRYSINGDFSHFSAPWAPDGLPYTNWTEYLAAQLQVTPPCAAETGLDSPATGQLYFMAEASAFHDTGAGACTSYAQGGARVSIPYGPGNRFFFDNYGAASGQLGQLTIPLEQQVANFLAHTTGFSDGDIVTVLAGGNDLFINRGVNVDGTVAQVLALEQAQAITVDEGNAMITTAAATAVSDMATAGTALANLVLNQIVANGAKHIVVVNLPDVSVTPDAAIWAAGSGQIVNPLHGGNLTLDMVTAFNTALATGLGVSGGESSHPEVLWIDAFSASDQQVATPAAFGLTNVTSPACQLDLTAANVTGVNIQPGGAGTPLVHVPIQSSLFCSYDLSTDTGTLATDFNSAMTYLYADTVHPTPFGYRLLASLVGARMAAKGWL